MNDLDAIQRVQFVDGLIGYLDVRAWAFKKIQTNPVGSELIDFRMYHYLYFTNLFGAIDWVKDFLPTKVEQQDFEEHVQRGFPVPGDLLYARELRNSIVHRGLDPTMQGIQYENVVFAVSPPVVHSRTGSSSYVCSMRLLVQLAMICNRAADVAIYAVLKRQGLLDAAVHQPDKAEMLSAIEAASHMPDWAKTMAAQAFAEMDFEAMAADMAQARTRQLTALLQA